MSVLELEDVSAFYGSAPALHDVNLRVEPGEIVVVLGSNGAGKTTLMRAVSRTVHTSGDIRFNGEPITDCSTENVAVRGIGHVPEGRGTFVDLTVDENLRLGVMARAGRMPDLVAGDMEAVLRLFPALREMRDRQAGALSGGQQQLLAIARALLGRPTLLMLDELSLGLAPRITEEIFAKLDELRSAWGLGILLAEQNVRLSLRAADRGYLLGSGVVEFEGAADELASSNAVERAYLGV